MNSTREIRLVPATLQKLSICPCGFPTLKTSILLGTRYKIDPSVRITATMICGGCSKEISIDAVWVERRGDSEGGYLPASIFHFEAAA